MLKKNVYKVVREYNNQCKLEELIRHIIRCHLDEFCAVDREAKFPEYVADNRDKQLTGQLIYG